MGPTAADKRTDVSGVEFMSAVWVATDWGAPVCHTGQWHCSRLQRAYSECGGVCHWHNMMPADANGSLGCIAMMLSVGTENAGR